MPPPGTGLIIVRRVIDMAPAVFRGRCLAIGVAPSTRSQWPRKVRMNRTVAGIECPVPLVEPGGAALDNAAKADRLERRAGKGAANAIEPVRALGHREARVGTCMRTRAVGNPGDRYDTDEVATRQAARRVEDVITLPWDMNDRWERASNALARTHRPILARYAPTDHLRIADLFRTRSALAKQRRQSIVRRRLSVTSPTVADGTIRFPARARCRG